VDTKKNFCNMSDLSWTTVFKKSNTQYKVITEEKSRDK